MGKYLVIQEILIMNLLIVVVLMFFTVLNVAGNPTKCCKDAGSADSADSCATDDSKLCRYIKPAAGGALKVACVNSGPSTGPTKGSGGDPPCFLKPGEPTTKLFACGALPKPCLPKATGTTGGNNNNNNNNHSKGVSSATSVIFAISLEILICTIF